ncbi:hypothetical protein KY361_04420 [Candidatus Woesearchaeota archaeon]|nr:hypothetical protein [Candidatus Woesearchaeota archaeon]
MAEESIIVGKLCNNQNILLVSSSKDHNQVLIDLHKAVSNKFKGILAILTHKSAATLASEFKKNNIDYSNYFFIDFVEEDNKPKRCFTISSLFALTELALKIEKIKKMYKTDLIILDNILSMLIYNNDVTVLRFLHDMMVKVRKKGGKAIYSILKEGNEKLIADISLFADEIVEI